MFSTLTVFLASVVAAPALRLGGETAHVTLFTAWSSDELDCLGSSCPLERVYNVFIDAAPPASGMDLCQWTSSLAANGNPREWQQVGGENVELRAEAFLGVLFGDECLAGLGAAADQFVRVNGAAPERPVHVNVVEIRNNEITPENVGDHFCYSSPRDCEAQGSGERIVINVLIADWCESGCLSTREAAPACDTFGCDAAHGRCVDDDVCVCDDGYVGARCATRVGCASSGCSGRGLCDEESGVCSCAAGFEGPTCADRVQAPMMAPAPAMAAAGQAGEAVDVDQSFIAPYSVFPRGNFTHFGMLSPGQIPVRKNFEQNARRPAVAQPLATDRDVTQGYVAVQVNKEAGTAFLSMAFTAPQGLLPLDANGPGSTHLFAGGQLGFTGEAVAEIKELWCTTTSWVGMGWDAWKMNATVELDAAALEALDGAEGYVVLGDGAGAPMLRAQLQPFDHALSASLTGIDAAGAGLFLVDSTANMVQFWVYYTAPVDFIELGATLDATSDNHPVHPLPLGSFGLHRVGDYDPARDPPFEVVCSISKMGVWHFGGSTYGGSVA